MEQIRIGEAQTGLRVPQTPRKGEQMQAELVIRAQSGDIDAFSTLTAGRPTACNAAARLILRHDEQAADAAHPQGARAAALSSPPAIPGSTRAEERADTHLTHEPGAGWID
jgi:hypothetical protein